MARPRAAQRARMCDAAERSWAVVGVDSDEEVVVVDVQEIAENLCASCSRSS